MCLADASFLENAFDDRHGRFGNSDCSDSPRSLPNMTSSPDTRRTRLDRIDASLGLVLFVCASAILIPLQQRELWGDGWGLYRLLENPSVPWWRLHYHAAYLPIARILGWIASPSIPLTGWTLASSLPVAAGLMLNFWSLRLLRVPRPLAFWIAILAGLTPAMVMFGTLLEVHGLQFAGASAAILASILALRVATVSKVIVAHAAAFLCASLTHATSPVLIPGWASWCTLLIFRERRHTDPKPNEVTVWFKSAIGASIAVAIAAAVVELSWDKSRSGSSSLSVMSRIVAIALDSGASRRFFEEWILVYGWALVPLFILGILTALAWARGNTAVMSKRVALMWLVWMAVPTSILNIWSVPNLGGYSASLVPMVAIGIGLAIKPLTTPRTQARWTLLFLTASVLQVLHSAQAVERRSAAFNARVPAVFEEAVRALPEGGTLITLLPTDYSIGAFKPGWRQANVTLLMEQNPTGEFLRAPRGWVIKEVVRFGGPVALDRRFVDFVLPPGTAIAEQKEAFLATLDKYYDFASIDKTNPNVVILRPNAAAEKLEW